MVHPSFLQPPYFTQVAASISLQLWQVNYAFCLVCYQAKIPVRENYSARHSVIIPLVPGARWLFDAPSGAILTRP
jgi:hypothetical protein